MTEMEKMTALLGRLRREKNGAVTDAMCERGTDYGLNYGVSLPTIREVSAEYAPDHTLAATLWRQDVRELKLAALFVEDPGQVTAGQMQAWSGEWTTGEMAEQSAMQLFWRAPQAWQTARSWLAAPDELPLRRLAAYYMIGKRAAGATLEEVLGILQEPFFDSRSCESSAAYALRELYRSAPRCREAVREALERIPSPVAEEVRWQIEYLEG